MHVNNKISTVVFTHIAILWDGTRYRVPKSVYEIWINEDVPDSSIIEFCEVSVRKSAISKMETVPKKPKPTEIEMPTFSLKEIAQRKKTVEKCRKEIQKNSPQ